MPSIMEGSLPICTSLSTQRCIMLPITPSIMEGSMANCCNMLGSTPIRINMQGCITPPVMPSIME
eukprot:13551651-Alexandrium_andersonii.AAC.1